MEAFAGCSALDTAAGPMIEMMEAGLQLDGELGRRGLPLESALVQSGFEVADALFHGAVVTRISRWIVELGRGKAAERACHWDCGSTEANEDSEALNSGSKKDRRDVGDKRHFRRRDAGGVSGSGSKEQRPMRSHGWRSLIMCCVFFSIRRATDLFAVQGSRFRVRGQNSARMRGRACGKNNCRHQPGAALLAGAFGDSELRGAWGASMYAAWLLE